MGLKFARCLADGPPWAAGQAPLSPLGAAGRKSGCYGVVSTSRMPNKPLRSNMVTRPRIPPALFRPCVQGTVSRSSERHEDSEGYELAHGGGDVLGQLDG